MSWIAKTISNFSRREVDALFKQASLAYRDPGITVLCAPDAYSFGRVLPIISRKVGTAPVRNKIKRQLRAIFYLEKLYAQGIDCAVIVRPEAATYTFEMLKTICITALQRYAKRTQKSASSAQDARS